MEQEERKQEEDTARELEEIRLQWERRKTESKGGELKRIAKKQGRVQKSSQVRRRLSKEGRNMRRKEEVREENMNWWEQTGGSRRTTCS